MYDKSDYSNALRNLAAAYENKLKNISDIKDITLELKEAIIEEEKNIADDSDYFDAFDEILNRREAAIDEQEIIATTINHYKSQLPPDMLNLIKSAERSSEEQDEDGSEIIAAIKKISEAEKTIYQDIQAVENFNLIRMKKLMADLKKKLDNIKKNRIIMDKFITGNDDIKTGALMNKKK